MLYHTKVRPISSTLSLSLEYLGWNRCMSYWWVWVTYGTFDHPSTFQCWYLIWLFVPDGSPTQTRLESVRSVFHCSTGCVPNCSKLHCTVCIQILVRLNKVVSFKLLVEKMKKTWRDVIYKYNRQTDPVPLSFRTVKYFRKNFILFRLHYIWDYGKYSDCV